MGVATAEPVENAPEQAEVQAADEVGMAVGGGVEGAVAQPHGVWLVVERLIARARSRTSSFGSALDCCFSASASSRPNS